MSIKIANDTANGNVILKGQNVAGDRIITMPNLDCELAPRMQLMTAQNSTSVTSIDFTGIPSWAKKITVMFDGVSTNGSSIILIRLGTSGGVESTGYLGSDSLIGSSVSTVNHTDGFGFGLGKDASFNHQGSVLLQSFGANTWVANGAVGNFNAPSNWITAGSKTLAGTLDRIRITTVNGTDTFDAGQINVLYEG